MTFCDRLYGVPEEAYWEVREKLLMLAIYVLQ